MCQEWSLRESAEQDSGVLKLQYNFVHAAREETPTELYEIPAFQWQLRADWGSVILSIWSSRQHHNAYDPPDQSATASGETATTLFISATSW